MSLHKNRWVPIILIVCFNLAVGLVTFRDYGTSIDETGMIRLGNISLTAYKTLTAPTPKLFSDSPYNLIYYGPLFAMLTFKTAQLLQTVFPLLIPNDIWHLCYFLCFLTAVFLMYSLSLRWFSVRISAAIALLFSAQPLLWGHAFINPKDIPFMTFFLASIVGGFYFIDTFFGREYPHFSRQQWQSHFQWLYSQWRQSSPTRKRHLLITTLLWLGFLAIFLLFLPQIYRGMDALVSFFYTAPPETLAGKIFQGIAQNRQFIPLEKYFHKAHLITWQILIAFVVISLAWILWRWLSLFGIGLQTIRKTVIEQFRWLAESVRRPSLWLAAILLGAATSVRVGAPYAAFLIMIFAFGKAGKRAIAPLCAYLLLAGMVTYLTWPALWSNPLSHFIESARLASNFPWQGNVLFLGEYLKARSLPWFYLPLLFSIQFTEPLVTLAVIGSVLILRKQKESPRLELILLVMGWFVIPMLYFLLERPPLYDNFRQVLFLVPPLFLLAGIPLQALLLKFRHTAAQILIFALLLLPGLIGYLQLHPYEYAYYNAFIGGLKGAAGRFETEYWKTSFRQAIEEINRYAEQDQKVLVWGNTDLVAQYARQDLTVNAKKGRSPKRWLGYDYAIISTRNEKADNVFQDAPVLFIIQRQGVAFAVVKDIRSQPSP